MNSHANQRLHRLVMRRAAWVVGAVLLLAALLGTLRLAGDVDEEVRGAQALAELVAQLQALQELDDAAALQRLKSFERMHPLRHMQVSVHDEDRRLLWSIGRPADSRAAPSWTIGRPDGRLWRVTLSASSSDERQEAAFNLLSALGLLTLGAAALLLVMRWNVVRAFEPLRHLLGAIDQVEHGHTATLRRLPTMPIQELESLAGALRHLATSLDEAQARRQVLAQKVFSLQEDERAHLAQELHDEMGQRLTSMRVDAAWLAHQLPADSEWRQVVRNLEAQCEDLQVDMRELLQRLRPLSGGPDDEEMEPGHRLIDLLRSLTQSWSSASRQGMAVTLELQAPLVPWSVPRPVLLAVFRMTQEALTNAARHSDAAACVVRLEVDANRHLRWSVRDDGVGLRDNRDSDGGRGLGLSGMRERAWSLGSELLIDSPGVPPRPGLLLQAVFDLGTVQRDTTGLPPGFT